jgi:YfiH family protein
MMRDWLLQPEWPAPRAVRALCTSRRGGVSAGPYASMNLASHVGDDPVAVSDNRRLLEEQLGLPSEPLWLSQVHGIGIVDADAPGSARVGDAAITRRPGRVLTVLVADCLPVLLARRDGTAVAVAHAGWRGLAAGVTEAIVAALGGPPGDVLAWLGPAIGQAHFEVGEEVRAAFCDHDARAELAFASNARGRWQCDLHRLAHQRLERAGVTSIHGQARCTFEQSESYYSFRRDGPTGRFAALIWIEPCSRRRLNSLSKAPTELCGSDKNTPAGRSA